MTHIPPQDRPPAASAGGRSACPRPRFVPILERALTAQIVALVGVILFAEGLLALNRSKPTEPTDRAIAHTAPPTSTVAPAPAPATPSRASVVADTTPVRVRIPRIGVDSALEPLEIGPDGHLGTPQDPDRVGWWIGGADPGLPGAAVVVGHVDSRTGPAVFHRLSELRPDDRIDIARADGTRAAFSVTALHSYAKDAFPTEAVYGAGADPVLRLITCGGRYDKRRHAYPDNLVVFAEPRGRRPPLPTGDSRAGSTSSPSTTSRSRS